MVVHDSTPFKDFEIIRQASDTYLSSKKAGKTILSKEVMDLLSGTDYSSLPLIVSIRSKSQYEMAHVCTALNIPWDSDFLDNWLSKNMPKDRQIVIYCCNGHYGGAATALVNLLGYDAINLQWGYTSWMWCRQKAPAEFVSSRGGGIGMNYIVETKANESTTVYKQPQSSNLALSVDDIIINACNKWLKSKVNVPKIDEGPQNRTDYPFITPRELFYWLHNEDPNNQPFVVSITEQEQYLKGHIPASINIPLDQLVKLANLQKLPPNKPIITVSSDGMSGSQAMAILNILGYDARNMLFGMTGWTENENIAPGHFQRYKPGTKEYKDIGQFAFCTGPEPGTYFQPSFYQCPNI